MTITLDVTPEMEGRLQREAALSGIAISAYVLNTLEEKWTDQGTRTGEPKCSLLELEGLGAEMWRKELAGRDAQEYVSQMRDEWDQDE